MYPNLFWKLKDKTNFKKCNFDLKALDPCYNIDISNMPCFLDLLIKLKYNITLNIFKSSQGLVCIKGAGNCWRALARQQPILYNSEKRPKFVRCKIGDI